MAEAELTAGDPAFSALFGDAVALDGDVAVVGARGLDSATGAAYVYRRSGSTWTQEAKLTGAGVQPSDAFGHSVAVSGNLIAVGVPEPFDFAGGSTGPGSVHLFRFDGTSWLPEAVLAAAGGADWDQFGFSVALDGNLLAVGAPGDEPLGNGSRFGGTGSVRMFRFDGSVWTEEAQLTAADAGAAQTFGRAVSVAGNLLVVGAPGDDVGGTDAGAGYVFRFDGVNWNQEAKLLAPLPLGGEHLGFAVAGDGTAAVLGAPLSAVAGTDAGQVHVFRFATGWSHEATLAPASTAAGDIFGASLSLQGDLLLAGAYGAANGAGTATVFEHAAGVWTETLTLTDPNSAMLGAAAAVSGTRGLVGGPLSDGAGVVISGAAWVFGVLPPPDCNGNGVPDDQDLAAGTSADCNGNGIPDECDIADGTELDCNGNGVPDSCDLAAGTSADCNANGVPDECDIASGTSSDCDGNGVPDECDPDCDSDGIPDACEPDCDGDGIPDDCEVDCNGNGVPDDCDLLAGTSLDCNGNGVPDECDIASGLSGDCNGDGIPDECQADCNGNGIPDDCDIASGTASDCNGNGVPDECDIAGGLSSDCNADGIPDECQADCNGNGIPDDCDIASGVASDCNGNGIPDSCDIAAGTSADVDGDGVPDECQADCNGNGVPDAFEIASGLAPDCNGNGVPDDCDLASGLSSDLNANGIPDECEGDCNGNGIPDDVDIVTGTSADCNGNGIPDECDLVSGASSDVDGNGVPDECQPDCNGNGLPDAFEVASGISPDCNGNGVPDTCDIASGASSDADGNGIPDECQGQWVDLGGAKAGSNGLATATGTGTLIGGDPGSVALSNALPLASAWFVFGLSALNAPFKGGTLVPVPDLVVGGLPVDAAGGLALPFVWPVGVPQGAAVFMQFWISDPGVSHGLAASNGLSAVAP